METSPELHCFSSHLTLGINTEVHLFLSQQGSEPKAALSQGWLLLLHTETRTVHKELRDLLTFLGKMELQVERVPTGEIIRVVRRKAERRTVSLAFIVLWPLLVLLVTQ